MKKTIILGMIVCIPSVSMAQWSLERCIEYAITHNIQLRQQENSNHEKELSLSTARNAYLPDLSFGAQESFSFGRGLTADNTYTNKSTNSTSLQLSTSVPLFTGMEIQNRIRQARADLDAATADLEKARNDIRVEVAKYYMQAVYGHELTETARRQVGIDSLQTERLRHMLKAGKAAAADVARQEASLAQSRLSLTQTEIECKNAILSLRLLLELTDDKTFNIVMPASHAGEIAGRDIPSAEYIYEQALTQRPEIQSGMIRLKGAEYNINIAKAGLYPKIYLSGSIGTNYYKTSGIEMDGFGKQMKNNFNQGIGLSVSVPIFNRFQTRNNIRAARVEQLNQQLSMENVKKTLYNEVQQVYLNTIGAREKYASSLVARNSSEEAFRLTKAKYENGKATITEFNEAKNDMLKSESDLARAKYEYIYQMALVDFYCGKNLKF
ncbi:MAG: TolC family protein [Prevotella sp.]